MNYSQISSESLLVSLGPGQLSSLAASQVELVQSISLSRFNDDKKRCFIYPEGLVLMEEECMTISPDGEMMPFTDKIRMTIIESANNLNPEGTEAPEANISGVGFSLGDQEEFEIFFKQPLSEKSEFIRNLSTKIIRKEFHSIFKPIKKIGTGAFASVFLSRRISDQEQFAVKAFSKKGLAAMQDGMENLQNEIRVLRSLDHRGVLKLQGVYETDNSIYLALQLISGCHLFELLQKKRHAITHENIPVFLFNLLTALKHVHEQRIMHRDLKLENIMLRGNDIRNPVIVDFGLATHCDLEDYLHYRCGTPGYILPEIVSLSTFKHVEPVCDIFSVGVIFYILLVRRPLFPGITAREVYANNASFTMNIRPQEIDICSQSASATDLLKKMLEVDPNRRITAEEALAHPYFEQKLGEEMREKYVASPAATEMPNKAKFSDRLADN